MHVLIIGSRIVHRWRAGIRDLLLSGMVSESPSWRSRIMCTGDSVFSAPYSVSDSAVLKKGKLARTTACRKQGLIPANHGQG